MAALSTALCMALSGLPRVAQASLLAQGPSETDIARAKGLYMSAEELAGKGKHAEAVPLYEEAYELVPGKHGFAYKVGVSAFKAGDCAKAKEYLEHLVTYGSEQAKLAEKVKEGRSILGKIKTSKCDQTKPAKPAPAPQAAAAPAVEEENPFAIEAQKAAAAKAAESKGNAERAKAKKQRRKGKFKSVGLMSLGGAMVVGGGVLLVLARRNGKRLGELAEPSEQLGMFPGGDFACRIPGEPCPYKLSVNMRRFTGIGYALIALGLVAAGGGAYFWMEDKKQKAGPEPKRVARRWRPSPMWLSKGAGAMATMRF